MKYEKAGYIYDLMFKIKHYERLYDSLTFPFSVSNFELHVIRDNKQNIIHKLNAHQTKILKDHAEKEMKKLMKEIEKYD